MKMLNSKQIDRGDDEYDGDDDDGEYDGDDDDGCAAAAAANIIKNDSYHGTTTIIIIHPPFYFNQSHHISINLTSMIYIILQISTAVNSSKTTILGVFL